MPRQSGQFGYFCAPIIGDLLRSTKGMGHLGDDLRSGFSDQYARVREGGARSGIEYVAVSIGQTDTCLSNNGGPRHSYRHDKTRHAKCVGELLTLEKGSLLVCGEGFHLLLEVLLAFFRLSPCWTLLIFFSGFKKDFCRATHHVESVIGASQTESHDLESTIFKRNRKSDSICFSDNVVNSIKFFGD